MELQDCIDLVEKLLSKTDKQFKDSHDMMLYQRGYLTGVLARLILTEPSVRIGINNIINNRKH